MRSLKLIMLFVLAFLVGMEVFLYNDIHANLFKITPISLLFACVIVALRIPAIYLYKMLFDKEYRKRQKYKHRHRHHHHHSAGSSHHKHHHLLQESSK